MNTRHTRHSTREPAPSLRNPNQKKKNKEPPERKSKEPQPEPQPGPAPKTNPKAPSKADESSISLRSPAPALVKVAADSSSSPTREMKVKDWTEFHIHEVRKLAVVFRDHIESIDNNCFKVDERKLDLNNNGSYTLALGLVQQIHSAIKNHVELLQELDTRMCEEFTNKYPKKPTFNFSRIEPAVSSSTEAEVLMSLQTGEGDSLINENEGQDVELENVTLRNELPAPEASAAPDSDEEVYKTALLAGAGAEDEEGAGNLNLSRRSRRIPLNQNQKPALSDSELSNDESRNRKARNSKKSLRRSSTSGGVSEYADALEDLETVPAAPTTPLPPIHEDKTERQADKRTKREEEPQPHCSGTGGTGTGGSVKNKDVEFEILQVHKAKVVVQKLGKTILKELKRNSFVTVACSTDDEGNDQLLAAIRKKVVLKPTEVKSKLSKEKVKSQKKGPSKGKEDTVAQQLLSDNDNESDDEDLEAVRLKKHELPQIRPKPLVELLALSSEEAASDDGEEEAKRMLLVGDEDHEVEKKGSSKEKKSRSADKAESSIPKPKTPYTGPAIKLDESDSEDSDSKSKSKRSLRSRTNKRSPAKKDDFESSGTEPVSRNKKSKSQDAEKEKRTSPSKTGRVPCSDSDSEEDSRRKLLKDQEPKAGSSKAAKDSKRKPGASVVVISNDSDSDTPKRATRNGCAKEKKEAKDPESDSSDDSDFIPTKKARVTKQKSKSDSDVQEISNDSESGSESGDGKKKKKKRRTSKGSGSETSTSVKQKKKKKRLRRIKRNSSSEEDKPDKKDGDSDSESGSGEDQNEESQGSGKGRKNIRKLMKVKDLKVSTKEAARQEEARKMRLSERQKMYNEIFKPPQSDKLESLVLDFNKETKEALVSVDGHIVSQLKPHQATGIQFMWNACFESLESKKEGGCILAHCMGLGKTLQSVAFVHTLVNHKETGVRTVLVICPLNTVENWYTEFRKWTRNAGGRVNIHRLWEEKGNDRYKSLQTWHKHGGAGILHYEGFRALINSGQKKGRQRVQSRFLEIIKQTLMDPGPNLVICDEGHLLKNASSQVSKAVNRVKTKRRIVLTGTPLQNNLNEYHTMMSFVKPSLLGDIKEFRNRFVNPILNGQHKDSQPHDVVLMKKRAHVLHKLLEGCVQRLDYTVLTPFLPPKFEYAIIVNLTEKQKDLYDYYIKNLSNNREGFSSTKLFSDYTILNKICTHPIALTYLSRAQMNREDDGSESEGSLKDFICDDETTTPDDSSTRSGSESDSDAKKKAKSAKKKTRSMAKDERDDEPVIVEQPNENKNGAVWYKQFFESDEEMKKIELSGKLRVLMEILQVAESVGDKVLIFSQYLTTLDLIEEFLAELDKEGKNAAAKASTTDELLSLSGSRSWEGRYRPQIDYFRIDGSTKSNIRQDQCDKFNQGLNKAKVFLISIRAGGLGINLHGANRVVIFDASWNPSQDLQAIFRVYRFGQSKPSYIYRLLARGTMEEKIYNRQVVKLSLSCRVVDEQQIERHYHYDDLQKMYHFNRDDPTERPTPIVPKDKLLAGLLQTHKDWVFSYLEHDSLLENKQEEELSEEAKKLAWEEFNNEGTRMANQSSMALLEFRHAYDTNPGAFGEGTKDWSLYTMQRLHEIHPTAHISSLVITVRDISKILGNLTLQHPVMIGKVPGATPQARAEATNYCLEYIDKLRKTYRERLNEGDIMYLGVGNTPMSPELVRALIPSRNARPPQMQQYATNVVVNRQHPLVALPGQSSSQFQHLFSAMMNGSPSAQAQANALRQQGPRSSVASVPRPYIPPGQPQVVEIDE